MSIFQGMFNKDKLKMPEAQYTDLSGITKDIDEQVNSAKQEADPSFLLQRNLGDIEGQVQPQLEAMKDARGLQSARAGALPGQMGISEALSQKTGQNYSNEVQKFKNKFLAQGYGVKSMDQLENSLHATNQVLQMRKQQLELKREYQYQRAQAKGAITGMIGGIAGKWLGMSSGSAGGKPKSKDTTTSSYDVNQNAGSTSDYGDTGGDSASSNIA